MVLNVWASWCPPCRSEMPLLERTHERIAAAGRPRARHRHPGRAEDALRFLREKEITFPSLRDRDREYGARARRHRLLPETFLIDREGRIAASRRGPVDQAWLDEHLEPLLEESA